MDFKSYFSGHKARVFWINVCLMIAVLIIVPTATLFYVDNYTHHGERIEVPNLDGVEVEDAKDILAEKGLIGVVTDSVRKAGYKPGTVCLQTPKAGSEVKDGRMVYLSIIKIGESKVAIPSVAGVNTAEEARQILKNLGFDLTEDRIVESKEKGLVLNVYQGARILKAGQEVTTDRPLTLYVGSGDMADTLGISDLSDDDFNFE